ncbi:MAG TPA: SMC family ATPase [Gemmataceae bacterium]|jgi:exonuclease SbcC|nr:SMC family ATPase [Gemmataceae bacterium]
MIPRRIKLSGFLSYQDEQEIVFDGSALWMLSGVNGSGKSTIFDAVTYSLFGHHRGGSTNAGELINKESKSLSVEFEFLVDGQPFQIRRTLRRDAKGSPKGTQNVLQLDTASGKWIGVPDTNLSEGFKAWVRDKIGLDYVTFTSSVLLLQGRAEKLLDSTPKGRAEVLAGIVDLERYQKLHEKADAQRKTFKVELESVRSREAGIPDVSDFELLAAENKIDDAEQERATATQEVERLQALEFQVQKWVELQSRRAGLKKRWESAQELIKESAAIETAFARLRDLRDVIPHILIIQEKQQAAAESTRATGQLQKLRTQHEEERTAVEAALDVAKRKREEHRKSLMQEEQKLEDVGLRMRELSGQLSQLQLFEEQTAKLVEIENALAQLPSDPVAIVRQAQDAYDRCVELDKVAPLFDRFAAARIELREATQRGVDLKLAEQKTREAGEQAKRQHTEAKAKLEAATQARRQADESATEARTYWKNAKNAADEFGTLEGAKVCRACGQALTPAHWEDERAKRNQELEAATDQNKKALAQQTAAHQAETSARDQFDAADKELTRLREDWKETKKEEELAGKAVDRLGQECRFAYLSLPQTYRAHISSGVPNDWLATTWPTADEQRLFKKEAGELNMARATLKAAQTAQSQFDRLTVERQAAQATASRIRASLPKGETSNLRVEEARLRVEEKAFSDKVRGSKKLLQENELEHERLTKELAGVVKTLANLDAQLSVEEATRTQHRDAIERAVRLLPEKWREAAGRAGLAEQNKWKAELEELVGRQIEERHRELAQARHAVEALRQDVTLADQEAESFAVDARQPVELVKAQLAAAKGAVAAKDEELQKAREAKAILDRHRAERERLKKQALELEKELNFAVLLAQLLGRDRLQRHLVRTAERQIVDFANSILDRLSGGQLYLRLVGNDDGATERSLDLEAYNRVTGGSAINVAFLSGSQRFRVAVALALGIGQFASRSHRPIESVIIDEGFGCLDRNGRQVMIQELQNLKGHLKCILLVSHQEEFADAFADGYRFELEGGATRVRRVRG